MDNRKHTKQQHVKEYLLLVLRVELSILKLFLLLFFLLFFRFLCRILLVFIVTIAIAPIAATASWRSASPPLPPSLAPGCRLGPLAFMPFFFLQHLQQKVMTEHKA